MKGGLAVMLELARTIVEPVVDVTLRVLRPRRGRVRSTTGCARSSANGPDLLVADAALLGEPTAAGSKPVARARCASVVHAAGARAHTARAWMGRNAIHRWAGCCRCSPRTSRRQPVIQGLPAIHEGLQAVFVEGGAAGNVVPIERP